MWDDLNTPDDFADDWYGELTNQCGHTLLGIIAAGVVCLFWRLVFGDMPDKTLAFLAISGAYGIVIEWRLQGWLRGDSWFDWAMVTLGAAGVLWPFSEVETTPSGTTLHLVHGPLIVIFSVWAVMLSARVLKRRKQV